MIKLVNLGKDFGDFTAVNNLNLEVFRGDIFGFIGPNGAGKTTTIKMILNSIQPTRGSAYINDIEVSKHSIEAHQYIGYIPETTNTLYFDLSVLKFLIYSGRLKGLTKDEARLRSEKLLEIVGLKDFKHRKIGQMSTGMKQRANMAQALIANPEIIIADEPTLGLDPVGKNDLLNLMLELKNLGKTLFVSSHILDELEKVVDKVAVINRGEIAFDGTLDKLQKEFKADVFYLQVDEKLQLYEILISKDIRIIKEDNLGYVIKVLDSHQIDIIIKEIYGKQLRLTELRSVESPLERLFFDTVSDKDSQDALDLDLIHEVIQ